MEYEYTCTNCNHIWIFEQRITDDKLTQCPMCEQQTAKRLISGPSNFILKGSGWYKDGYSSSTKDNSK